MCKNNIAYISFADSGMIAIDAGKFHTETFAPMPLLEIKSVISFEDGFLIIDTNYGEEYVDLYCCELLEDFDEIKFFKGKDKKELIELVEKRRNIFKNVESFEVDYSRNTRNKDTVKNYKDYDRLDV